MRSNPPIGYLFLATLLFTTLLLGFILYLQTPVAVIWIPHKTSINFPDSLSYDKNIAISLQKNNRNLSKNNTFLATSYDYLQQVYFQNPHAEEATPSLSGNQQTLDIRENITLLTDIQTYYNESTQFNVSFQSAFFGQGCSGSLEIFSANIPSLGYRTENFYDSITDCLNSVFPSSGRIVVVGNDHANSFYLVSSAKKIDPDAKIGIFVFDEHIDIYGLKDSDNILAKSNVFGKLLLEGSVGYIAFIGTSNLTKNDLIFNPDQTFTQNQIFDHIAAYSDVDLQHSSPQKIIGKEIKEMKQRNITNILISIDLDVLPQEYTGFEYSILAPAIAHLRFPQNISRYPSLAEQPDGFSTGMNLDDLGNFIFQIKRISNNNFIEMGVNKKNLRVMGDIEELLPEQDLGNSTTKVAAELVKLLSS